MDFHGLIRAFMALPWHRRGLSLRGHRFHGSIIKDPWPCVEGPLRPIAILRSAMSVLHASALLSGGVMAITWMGSQCQAIRWSC